MIHREVTYSLWISSENQRILPTRRKLGMEVLKTVSTLFLSKSVVKCRKKKKKRAMLVLNTVTLLAILIYRQKLSYKDLMVLYRNELLHGPHSIWEIVFCKDIMRYNGQFFRCIQLYILHNEKYVISSSEDQCGCFIQWRTMVLQNWVYK